MSAIIKEVYDAFRSAGVSDEQATAAAQAIPSNGELAKKGDVEAVHSELTSEINTLRKELKNDISALRNELKNDISTLRAEVKSDIEALRAETRGDMKDLELRMTIKFFAATGLAVAGIKALDFLIG